MHQGVDGRWTDIGRALPAGQSGRGRSLGAAASVRLVINVMGERQVPECEAAGQVSSFERQLSSVDDVRRSEMTGSNQS